MTGEYSQNEMVSFLVGDEWQIGYIRGRHLVFRTVYWIIEPDVQLDGYEYTHIISPNANVKPISLVYSSPFSDGDPSLKQ